MKRIVIGFCVTAVLSMYFANGAVSAPAPDSHNLSTATPNCVEHLSSSSHGVPSSLLAQNCFATQGEALSDATGNASYASENDAQVARSEHMLATSAPSSTQATSYLIGTDYMDIHYGGAHYFYSTGKRCSDGYSFSNAKMPAGWGNDVSSSLNYDSSGCDHYLHYELENFKGSQINCSYTQDGGDGCYDMTKTNFNDKTSSEKWFAGTDT